MTEWNDENIQEIFIHITLSLSLTHYKIKFMTKKRYSSFFLLLLWSYGVMEFGLTKIKLRDCEFVRTTAHKIKIYIDFN